jgi:hypothetical protein
MKISIGLSILILLIASLFGISNQQRLTVVREHHATLTASAAQHGISIDPSNPDDPVRSTKRERENKEAAARVVADEFITFAREMEALEKKGEHQHEAMRKRTIDLMDRMMSLDTTQLKFFITAVQAANDLKDETRKNLVAFSIMTLANDHPQAALTLFTDSPDLHKDTNMGSHIVSSSLAKWAKEDPSGALVWVKNTSKTFPDLVTDDVKRSLISGTATQDPRLAFALIGELGMKFTDHSIPGIIDAAKTPEERTVTLAALREHLATITDEKIRSGLSDAGISDFTSGLIESGFAAGTQWIAQSNFTPAELESFADGLYNLKGEETGQWIGWVGEKLSPEKSDDKVRSLMRTWTRNDYQAAGKWLTSAADGPTKNSAIRSYAETVSEYEPATAAQWALTLPPGKDRDQTLRSIHRNWPKDDDAAKEAFKLQHGIK